MTAIIEYALYGREPENLKPFARGMFVLVKPNIDTNTARYINGTKGGRKSKKTATPEPAVAYDLTYEQEIARLRADEECRNSICRDFHISGDEFLARLVPFLERCRDDGDRKGRQGHENYVDCQSHLRYWMSKAYPVSDPATSPAANPATPRKKQSEEGSKPDPQAEVLRRYRQRIPGVSSDNPLITPLQYSFLFDRLTDEQLARELRRIRDGSLVLPTSAADLLNYKL